MCWKKHGMGIDHFGLFNTFFPTLILLPILPSCHVKHALPKDSIFFRTKLFFINPQMFGPNLGLS